MKRRKAIPKAIETEILDLGRRRCPVCFASDGDTDEKRGQIAHIDGDSSKNDLDNLAFMCLEHHDIYDSKTSQSKGFTIAEIKMYRGRLYDWVKRNLPSEPEHATSRGRLEKTLLSVEEPSSLESVGEINVDQLASEWGVQRSEVETDLSFATVLLTRLREAPLTRSQHRILQTVIVQYEYDGLPRRVVESATGYGYLSSEFFDELSVLIHFGFIKYDPDLDDLIYLDDSETWALIQELCERLGAALGDVIHNPDSLLIDWLKQWN